MLLRPCAAFALALLLVLARPAWSQFTPFSSHPDSILEGNWQSCRDDRTGQYPERIYDHKVEGEPEYEVHLGPANEFAIFKGIQQAHRPHDSPENLLKPYQVPVNGSDAKEHWTIPSLNLSFDVAEAGGSYTTCMSWYITLKPLKPVKPTSR
jgi:hypothetical protein